MHTLLPSMTLDDFKEKNDNEDDDDDDGNNDDIPDHYYRVEDRILMWMVAGEGEPPTSNGGLDIQISEGRECDTHDNSDDNDDIKKLMYCRRDAPLVL